MNRLRAQDWRRRARPAKPLHDEPLTVTPLQPEPGDELPIPLLLALIGGMAVVVVATCLLVYAVLTMRPG